MKVAILTHYYKSINYGGNLQAYALCKVIYKMGFDAEQICYHRVIGKDDKVFKRIISFIKRTIYSSFNYLFSDLEYRRNMKYRVTSINEFNINKIPHSKQVFTDDSLNMLNEIYDVFITGSDQVWNPVVLCPGFLLEFCSDDKKKISYAASVASNTIDIQKKERIKRAVSTFNAVSVREEDSVNLFHEMGIDNVEWVADPVFLVDVKHWRSISKPVKTSKNYILTYFLGSNKQSRIQAQEFASSNGFHIISIPHLTGEYSRIDSKCKNTKLYDVSPEQLLYLIDHAEVVFTDSFHVTAFSLIFRKNFYVYKRNQKDDMTSRLLSILHLFSLEDRFIDEHMSCFSVKSKIMYKENYIDFINYQKKSFEFLRKSLEIPEKDGFKDE